ncbi:helix-turn-helix domain-containing protein [Fusibacter sp. JL298sf-3]
MTSIRMSAVLAAKRREKGLTQEAVAAYLGISKASVSKWETGQSFPDVLMLPEIATFYNITMDELFGYAPTLAPEAIKGLYESYGKRFQTEAWAVLEAEVEQTLRKYYACPELVIAMAQWFLNYGLVSKDASMRRHMLGRSEALSEHLLTLTEDTFLRSTAEGLMALVALQKGDFERCYTLLGETPTVNAHGLKSSLIGQVHLATGRIRDAKRCAQINLYQSLMALVNDLLMYQSINAGDPAAHDKIYDQLQTVIAAFGLEHNGTNARYATHLIAAQVAVAGGAPDDALTHLTRYVRAVESTTFPVVLNRNPYFDDIDDWLSDHLYTGTLSPTTEVLTRRLFYDAVAKDPTFAALAENATFQQLLKRLEAIIHD